MAECFCGCGLKIAALAVQRKSANKMGRMVAEGVAAIEDQVMPSLPQLSPDARDVLRLHERAKEGREFRDDCRAVVHEDADFGSVYWPAVRTWIHDTQGMTSFLLLSPEEQQRLMRSAPA